MKSPQISIPLKAIRRILVIRRDKIGDLICLTPSLHVLATQFPRAKLDVLVHSYNAPVLQRNPNIQTIWIYQKKSKKDSIWTRFQKRIANFFLQWKIWQKRYDVVIASGNTDSTTLSLYTWLTGGKYRIGFKTDHFLGKLAYNVVLDKPLHSLHEAERASLFLQALGIQTSIGSFCLYPDLQLMKETFYALPKNTLKLGLFISARLSNNQWTIDKWQKLANLLKQNPQISLIFLWAPGSKQDPFFPGDDEAITHLKSTLKETAHFFPTQTVPELMSAIHYLDIAVTLDTGSLHMLSAMQKPLVALMTPQKVIEWGPWKTKNRIITGFPVATIEPEPVFEAIHDLICNEFNEKRA